MMICNAFEEEQLEHFSTINFQAGAAGELKYLMDYMRDQATELLKRSAVQDGAAMYRSQGGATVLQEIIEQIENAKGVLDTLRARKKECGSANRLVS